MEVLTLSTVYGAETNKMLNKSGLKKGMTSVFKKAHTGMALGTRVTKTRGGSYVIYITICIWLSKNFSS